MRKLDIGELRAKTDLNEKYVDFNIIRSSLSVISVAEDMGIEFSDPSFEGERRGQCPRCHKKKALSVNISTNRFNCFATGCNMKGGGVIDLFSRLHRIGSKEASHLLACAYELPPYDSSSGEQQPSDPRIRGKGVEESTNPEGSVTRSEFNELKGRFDRLSKLVFNHMLDNDSPGGITEEYDPPLTKEHVTH